MLRLGLTGGIASGKSAVAAMLRDLGFPVLSADAVAHHLMEPGESAYGEILKEFGPGVATVQGPIDRPKLAGIVFADPAKLARLNAILHPRVEEVMLKQFEEWAHAGVRDAAFVEAALLVEAGFDKKLDGLVVAWCHPQQQIERLLARGMNEQEARQRVAAQMPVEEKKKHATYVIDCSGAITETLAQVRELAGNLRQRS
jgi:dephospho-CoA kinase